MVKNDAIWNEWEILNMLKYRAIFGSTVYKSPIIYSEIAMKIALMGINKYIYKSPLM